MSQTIHKQVLGIIQSIGRGNLIFPADFLHLGNADAAKMTLSRLARQGIIHRLAQGIYLFPKEDPLLGTLYPSAEEIAQAIAGRDKARIMPTGLNALNQLGLSTQVPMKVVYLTDGAPRRIQVGNQTITFKKTTPKKLQLKGPFSAIVIQALEQLGKDQVTDEVIKKVMPYLQKENPELVLADAKLAPAWIAKILFASIKNLHPDD